MTAAEEMIEIFKSGKDIIINGTTIEHGSIKNEVYEGTVAKFRTRSGYQNWIVNFENVTTFAYKEV